MFIVLIPLSDGKPCSSSSYCSCCVVHQQMTACSSATSREANSSFKDGSQQPSGRSTHKGGVNEFKSAAEENQQVKSQTEWA